VTTEDDFQQLFDENRFDRTNYLVFADWLAERSDPREFGYRALGVRGLVPVDSKLDGYGAPGWWTREGTPQMYISANQQIEFAELPIDWFRAIPKRKQDPSTFWHTFDSVRTARDAAALAFSKLSSDRQAELLRAPPTDGPTKKPAPRKPRSPARPKVRKTPTKKTPTKKPARRRGKK
jgi:uncharacterized protein (TIGR02996 family)